MFHILYNNVGHHKRANINRTFMDGNVNSNDNLATANNDAGDAVGVSQPFRWYVAIVSNNTEKVCAEKIAALGYDTYVPTQKSCAAGRMGAVKSSTVLLFLQLSLCAAPRPTAAIMLSTFLS